MPSKRTAVEGATKGLHGADSLNRDQLGRSSKSRSVTTSSRLAVRSHGGRGVTPGMCYLSSCYIEHVLKLCTFILETSYSCPGECSHQFWFFYTLFCLS